MTATLAAGQTYYYGIRWWKGFGFMTCGNLYTKFDVLKPKEIAKADGLIGKPGVDETAAARTFARSSNREDQMFVVNFNEKVSLGLPRTTRFTNSTAELEYLITAAPTGGETALYDAIAKALEELQAGSRDKKVLIVVSDGGDNVSVHSLAQVMKLAEQSSAIIYTVGVFDEVDP